jgi:release factor glutamine methyltransferase
MNNFSIAQAIVEAAQVLRKAGVPEARREAGSLLEHIVGCDRTFLITHADDLLNADDMQRYNALVTRRAAGEPLQYLTGQQEFYGLEFEVTPDVLIPRPETELLIEKALLLIKEKTKTEKTDVLSICDLGTGSGCIAVTLLHLMPHARATALDISTNALRVAARNAARHNVSERLTLIESDCFAALEGTSAQFDLIASNPPYINEADLDNLQREVREHEPRLALTPGADGLRMIRRLLADAPRFVIPDGHLLIEIGYDQHTAVERMIDTKIWQLLDIYKDLQSIPRTVALQKINS